MTTGGSRAAIHVAVAPSEAAGLEARFRRQDFSVIHVDLTGVDDRRELCGRLGEAFLFPYVTTSLDAVIDLVSDLEWLGSEVGYMVAIEGADAVHADVLVDAVGILPAIADRWSSQHRGFVVLLLGSSHRELALAELDSANEQLRAAAALPWVQDTCPVEIVDHGDGPRPVRDRERT